MVQLRKSPSGKAVEVGEGGGAPLSFMYWVDPGTTVAPIDQTGAEGAPFSTLAAAITAGADVGITQFMLGRAIYAGTFEFSGGGVLIGTVMQDSLTPVTSFTGALSSPSAVLTLTNLLVESTIDSFGLFAQGCYFTGGAITLAARATMFGCVFFGQIPTVITFTTDDPGELLMDEYSYASFQNTGSSVVNGAIRVLGAKDVRAASSSAQVISSASFVADDNQATLNGVVSGQQIDIQWFGNVNVVDATDLLASGQLAYTKNGGPVQSINGSTMAWGLPIADFFNGAMAATFTVPANVTAADEFVIFAQFSTDSTNAQIAIENRILFVRACPKA